VELTSQVKEYLQGTADALRGVDRRLFMARTVRVLGPTGQRRAERELGWNRVTIRKGMHELTTGIRCADAFGLRGRKRAEEHLPHLLTDIRAIVDGQCQTDPSFQTQRLYTRLTAAAVRKQLIAQKGYTDGRLPTAETIRCKIHQLGYRLRKVQKCRPKKR
jgi:Rhodopirellula transposase DDE domain